MEITEIGLLTVKAETTYGTDPVPTIAANIIPVVRDQLTWSVNSTPIARKLLDGSIDMLPGFNTRPNITLKFQCELRGNRVDGANTLDITNGTAAQAIEINSLLLASNLAATYTAAVTPGVGGTSPGSRDGFVTYQPAVFTTQGPSVTCYWYTALKLHKLVGGKVTFDIIWEAGKMALINFTVTGKYVAPVDNAFSTVGATYLAAKPPLFDGATLTIGAYTPITDLLKIDLANKVDVRTDATSTDSIAGFVISSFLPKGTINPEAVTEAANPFWADWKASVIRTITCVTGTLGGNKFQGAFVCEYKGVPYGARNGVRIHQVAFDIVKSDLTQTLGSQFQLKFF
jgi:hypothetical protein